MTARGFRSQAGMLEQPRSGSPMAFLAGVLPDSFSVASEMFRGVCLTDRARVFQPQRVGTTTGVPDVRVVSVSFFCPESCVSACSTDALKYTLKECK